MQDNETSNDTSSTFEDEVETSNHAGEFIRAMLKKLVVFICFGPGVLGVLWIIGRLFKR